MRTVNCGEKALSPTKIVCVGRNYAEHAKELGNDVPDDIVLFFKPNSSISTVLHSHLCEPLHYEAELCFLVENSKLSAVGFGLDLTKRALQSTLKEKRLPWEKAKAFDGAAVFSEFVPLPGAIEDIHFELSIDGVMTQVGNTSLMLNTPQEIYNECSSFMSFENGDILMTGTPKGVGEIRKGSVFTGRVFFQDEVIIDCTWNAQ